MKLVIADVISSNHFRALIQTMRMKGSFTRNSAVMFKTMYKPKDIEAQVLDFLQNLPELQFNVERTLQKEVNGMYTSTTELMDADEDNILIVTVSAVKAPALTTVSVVSMPV